jgi:hypothetical protein
MCRASRALAPLTVVAVAFGGPMTGQAGAQSPDDPWAIQLEPGRSTSAGLVAGSGQDGLDCPGSPAGASEGEDGVAASILCIIGGARAGQRATEPPTTADPAAAPAPSPTAGEIVEQILTGAQ